MYLTTWLCLKMSQPRAQATICCITISDATLATLWAGGGEVDVATPPHLHRTICSPGQRCQRQTRQGGRHKAENGSAGLLDAARSLQQEPRDAESPAECPPGASSCSQMWNSWGQ